jgi:uncharacterized protein (TIGR01777 family)
MKVVIAGGSGLLGTALTRALMEGGHEVVVLTRGSRGGARVLSGARAVAWQPPNVGDWAREMAAAHAIINLAGATIARWPWTSRRKRVLRDSRLAATRALVGALAGLPENSRPAVLLSASGTDVYEGRDDAPADEETPPGGSFLARLCLDWEAAALRAEGLGVRVVLLRTSSVIARGAPFLGAVSLPIRLFVGGRLGSGRQWVSWVDLVDAVGLYLLALESNDIRGPLNVAAPDPRRQAAFARAVASELRRPSWFPTPGWIVRWLLRDQATLALGSRRVWPARALAAGYTFQRPRLEEALAAALGSATRRPGAEASADAGVATTLR